MMKYFILASIIVCSLFSLSVVAGNPAHGCDSMISSYTRLTNNYCALQSRAKAGDVQALSSSLFVFDAIKKIRPKMDSLKIEMSKEQLKRFTAIELRFNRAVSGS